MVLVAPHVCDNNLRQSRQVSLSCPPTHSPAIRYQSLHIRPPPSSQLSIFPANSSIWDKLGYYEVHFLIRRIRLLWGHRGPSVQGWKSVAEAGAGYRCCFFSLSLSTIKFTFTFYGIVFFWTVKHSGHLIRILYWFLNSFTSTWQTAFWQMQSLCLETWGCKQVKPEDSEPQ